DVNYRFAPSVSIDEASEHVRELFASADEVRIVDAAPGARPGLHSRLARELIALSGDIPRAKVGWTDVARFSALGIPAVNLGPGDPALAHADDERVDASEIVSVHRILRQWLQ